MIRRKPVPKPKQDSLTETDPSALSVKGPSQEPVITEIQLPSPPVSPTTSVAISPPVSPPISPKAITPEQQAGSFFPNAPATAPVPQPSWAYQPQPVYQELPIHEPPPPLCKSQDTHRPQSVPQPQISPIASPVSPFGPPEVFYITACCHCRKGIAASVHYSHCSFCRLDICAACSSSHPQAHSHMLQDMVSVKPGLFSKFLPDKKFCSGCFSRSRLKTHCELCKYSKCNECFFDKKPVSHTHSRFATVATPHAGFNLLPSDVMPLCSGLDHCGHCSKCSRGIPTTSSFNVCGKCIRNFKDSGGTCTACGPPCSVHPDRNITVKIEVVSAVVFASFKSDYIRCNHCTMGFRSLESFVSFHGRHTDCTIKVSAEALEKITMGQYRSCRLRPVRLDAPVTGSAAESCTICLNSFPPSALTICTACLKACSSTPFSTCAHCAPHAKHLHARHASSPDQAPPLVPASHPQVIEARAAIEAARKAEEARQAKQRRANRASLLGVGFKILGAFVGAEIALDLGGVGGGGGGVDLSGLSGMAMPMPSVPNMQFPSVFSGPVQSAAVDGIQ